MNSIPLDETDLYVLFHEYEQVFLFEKDTNKELWRTYVYGDPTCGLIGLFNEWALIGGVKLIIWKDGSLKTISGNNLRWIHEIRQIGENKVSILTDPWSKNSAIWGFEIYTEQKNKVRRFTDYHEKEYTENIKW